MEDPVEEPKTRVAIGMLVMLVWLALYIYVAIIAFDWIGRWPALAQMPFYLIVGIAWILPLKPLLAWMETGHKRD